MKMYDIETIISSDYAVKSEISSIRDNIIWWFCIVSAAYLSFGFFILTARAAEIDITDTDITGAVENKLLLNEAVSSHLIDVATLEGVVTLSGTVSNLLEKDMAVAVTQSIKGVKSVIDQIEVRTVIRGDDELKQDVIEALAVDPATDSYELDVKVNDGVVMLSGTVESWAEKLLAERVVKGVKGVEKIENKIDYEHETQRPDYEIQADIEQRLKWDPYIYEEFIDVDVNKGVVLLTGTVGSAAEKSYVRDDSRVAGVSRIDARRLEVRPWARDKMQRKAKLPAVTDKEIEQAVKKALTYDPRAASFSIEVESDNGEVTLRGTVDNLKAKTTAARDARNTTGVWKVHNNIKTRPTGKDTDSEIAQYIRDAFTRDPYVDNFDIAVTVRNRKAYLFGSVDNNYQKRYAADVASRVKGVADVANNININNVMVWKNDEQIEQDIKSEWAWSPYVDGEDLKVRSRNGVVTLSGVVDNWTEVYASVDNAFEGGATDVETYMIIADTGTLYDSRWSEPPREIWEF